MKFYISYFYQIRNFSPNMIPISTAVSDPSWFRKNGEVYVDKRGIVNGINCGPLSPAGITASCGKGCKERAPYCSFLKAYKKKIYKVDFEAFVKTAERICKEAAKLTTIDPEEELTCVLIVYEAPTNPCSERQTLVDWFKDNGVELREWYLH